MKTERIQIQISDSLGHVSAEIVSPDHPKAMMILAHGAGAGMDHPFLQSLSAELASEGIGTVRYNFPYMERRSRRPDPAPIAQQTVRAVINKSTELFPDLPLVVAGKSFGGRMSSQLLGKHTFTPVKAIIFYGFPLHPINRPGVERAEHLAEVRVPMLFLQGTRDDLAKADLIKLVCKGLPNATLHFIEGANHSFKIGKKDSIVDLAKKSRDWLHTLTIL
jgi:uncharacterized protein